MRKFLEKMLESDGEYKEFIFKDFKFNNESLGGLFFDFCSFVESNLSYSVLDDIYIKSSTFERCNLSNIKTIGGNLNLSNFLKVKFTGWDLENGVLKNTNFVSCKINLVNFSGSELKEVVFKDCDLKESSFQEVVLDDVRFIECDLRMADFSGASLKKVDLRGSKIEGLKISPKQFEGIIIDPSQATYFALLSGIKIKEL
ncbi:pentapeptide repeat-containing protein [Patescibacteria group bacterium]|nr:pentapeptide repeat-containing protein [Patescibacteria group bacterium]